MSAPSLRRAGPSDLPALRKLYAAAFPDEDLMAVVAALLRPSAPAVSFCIPHGAHLIAHVGFTRCGVGGLPGCAALLAPLAVHPDHQGVGLGSALVHHGLADARRRGALTAHVLGDPGYYGRFGFTPERRVRPPHRLPPHWRTAWQGLALGHASPFPRGRLRVPGFWRDPALWSE